MKEKRKPMWKQSKEFWYSRKHGNYIGNKEETEDNIIRIQVMHEKLKDYKIILLLNSWFYYLDLTLISFIMYKLFMFFSIQQMKLISNFMNSENSSDESYRKHYNN